MQTLRSGGEIWRDTVPVDGTPDADAPVAMKDILFVLVTVGFFGLAWLYARSCKEI